MDGYVEILSPRQCPSQSSCRNDAQPLILYSNGVNTPLEDERATVQALADKTGYDVVLVHNATRGLPIDLVRLARANAGQKVFPAAKAEAKIIAIAQAVGLPTVVVCHSAGCAQVNESIAYISDALRQWLDPVAIKTLQREGITRLDYGPANTRLEAGPYSRITVREGDIAKPLQWASQQYDEAVKLAPLQSTSFLSSVPLFGFLKTSLDAHNFTTSYLNTAAQDLIQVSDGR